MQRGIAAFAFVYGFAVFWAAPLFTTARDPFDSSYAFLAQLPAFLLFAALLREFRWAPVLWMLAGEAAFPILKGSNLWPLGIIAAAVCMAPGVLVYALMARMLRKPHPPSGIDPRGR